MDVDKGVEAGESSRVRIEESTSGGGSLSHEHDAELGLGQLR